MANQVFHTVFGVIADLLSPGKTLSDVPRNSLREISKIRSISRHCKEEINKFYKFDKLYFSVIHGDAAEAMFVSHYQEDRFKLLVVLTKKALQRGREIRIARNRRRMEITRKVQAKHQCPRCEVLLHPGSDYCEHCKFRLSVSCVMCTILIHQVPERPHYQILCDECDRNIR